MAARFVRRGITVLAALGLSAAAIVLPGASSAPAASSFGYTIVAFGAGVCGLGTVDLAGGQQTVPPSGTFVLGCATDLAVAPDGTVYGIAGAADGDLKATLVTFDVATGEVSESHQLTGAFTQSLVRSGGLAFDAAGQLYATFVTDEAGCSDLDNGVVLTCLYRVDPATGAATLVGDAGAAKDDVRMAFLTSSCAGLMYTAERQSNDDNANSDLAAVDPATGSVTSGPPFSQPVVSGLEFANPEGVLYAIALDQPSNDLGLFTVDDATGALTLVTLLSDDVAFALAIPGGACPITPVPPVTPVEPVVVQPTFTG